MFLSLPDPHCADYADLSLEARRKVRQWINAFNSADFSQGIGRALHAVAYAMTSHGSKTSYVTARRKYDAIIATRHWTALADGRSAQRLNTEATANKEFRSFITALAERHQRNSKAAYRKFLTAWANKEQIPGFEDFPGYPKPPFTYRTFARIIQKETDRRKLQSIRIGTTSKTNPNLAQVFGTRVGLYPGAVLQVDDVWHDHLVMVGTDPRPRRVIELGIMDLFSGCRPHWGCMPRLPEPDGKMRNLRGPEMRQFMAGWLWNFGSHPAGTRIMLEHGTAALPADIIALLSDSGLGISIDLQPIEGRQNALLNYWQGSQGGNFRAKASLESLHNLIHNDLSHLALQTGSPSSGLVGPHTTEVKAKWLEATIRAIAEKSPERLHLIRKMGALDFHSQFIPLIRDYYTFGLNSRTDHALEGWEKLGFIRTEYAAAPGSGHYLTNSEFLAMPREAQFAITEAAKHNPSAWTRRRKLSPMEVWNAGRQHLRPAPAPLICDLLGRDLAREVTVKGAYIRFRDKDISPDELIYEARAQFLNGAQRELPAGEKYSAMVLPFSPKHLFLLDARDRYVGHCELVQRVTSTDRPALIAAAGQKAHRNAEIMEPLRVRHAEHTQQEAADKEWNKRLADPKAAVTPEEIHARRVSAGHQATRTAAANRLQDFGTAQDWDDTPVYQTDSEIAAIWETLPEETELPDAL